MDVPALLAFPHCIEYNRVMADEISPLPPPTSQVPQFSRTSPAAIWSLILAILSFTCGWLFTAIPAVICGHVARSNIRKSGGTLGGKGIATAGLALGYVALVLGIMGIPLLVSMIQSDRERLHRLSTTKQEIISDDGQLNVTVPGVWTKMPGLNKQASLQVGDKGKRMYLIVITDAKTDVPNLMLQTHHQLTRDRMLQRMKNASGTSPVSLTIHGRPAIQDELSGNQNGTNVVFLHTTIDDGDHFQQILAWTLKSRWQQQNQLLRQIIETVHAQNQP